MANEYIEREAVMQKFADHVKRSNNSDFAPTPTWNQAVQIVEDFPAADVVEVVRCKDCRHSYEEPYSMGIAHRVCAYGVCVDCEVEDYFYCANGARMDSKKPRCGVRWTRWKE